MSDRILGPRAEYVSLVTQDGNRRQGLYFYMGQAITDEIAMRNNPGGIWLRAAKNPTQANVGVEWGTRRRTDERV